MTYLKLGKLKRDYEWALNNCFFQIIRNCSVNKTRIDAYTLMRWTDKDDGSHRFEISNLNYMIYPDTHVYTVLFDVFGMDQKQAFELSQLMFMKYMGLNRIIDELKSAGRWVL